MISRRHVEPLGVPSTRVYPRVTPSSGGNKRKARSPATLGDYACVVTQIVKSHVSRKRKSRSCFSFSFTVVDVILLH